jgi:NTP pyrophosphatase (non-canonical NTP hydrolase)
MPGAKRRGARGGGGASGGGGGVKRGVHRAVAGGGDVDGAEDDSLAALTAAALAFRDAREWKQFHNFKDLAVTLSLESAEVLEHAQWKTPQALEAHLVDPGQREHVADELADVLHVLLLLAEHAKIDLASAFHAKLKKTAKKYPVEKARGSAKKYDQL